MNNLFDSPVKPSNLRPQDFASYIGQGPIKDTLQQAVVAASGRGEPLDHVLLFGPPGLGKTTLAYVIAHAGGVNVIATSAPVLAHVGDLNNLLTSLKKGDILFIDEIHRLPIKLQEVLYGAMEDFVLDIKIGTRPVRLSLPKFTLIGATTRVGQLSTPLRDRFGLVLHLQFYSQSEMEEIIKRSSFILGMSLSNQVIKDLAKRSRMTPRIANRLLKQLRDYGNSIDIKGMKVAMDRIGIDELGLEDMDRMLLRAIILDYDGGPVGADTIAALIGEERVTVEDFIEPYLMQTGLLERTPRGRKVTDKAYKHLGISHE